MGKAKYKKTQITRGSYHRIHGRIREDMKKCPKCMMEVQNFFSDSGMCWSCFKYMKESMFG